MSSDLVRQALAFVDPEETNNTKQKMRRNRSRTQNNFEASHLFRHKSKKKKNTPNFKKDLAEENIKKLLALSAPTAVDTVDKIIERAIKGKPLVENIELKVVEEKSILFPEETFKDFEKSYFCS